VTTADLEPAANQIQAWVESGGVYVGTARPGGSGGTPFAVSHGFTSAQETTAADLEIPGTMFRVALSHASPVTLGAGGFDYWYNLGEDVLSPSTTGVNAARYPGSAPDFFVSGYQQGDQVLRNSAALVDETLGDGHVVLFSGEPNYRAYTEGSAFLLANALVYPAGAGAGGSTDVSSPAASSAVRAAQASAHPATGPGRPIRLEVPAGQVAAALAVVRGFTSDVTATTGGSTSVLTIPNPLGIDVEDHPFAFRLLPALRAAGVTVRSAVL
jgi:hypothetical protein